MCQQMRAPVYGRVHVAKTLAMLRRNMVWLHHRHVYYTETIAFPPSCKKRMKHVH